MIISGLWKLVNWWNGGCVGVRACVRVCMHVCEYLFFFWAMHNDTQIHGLGIRALADLLISHLARLSLSTFARLWLSSSCRVEVIAQNDLSLSWHSKHLFINPSTRQPVFSLFPLWHYQKDILFSATQAIMQMCHICFAAKVVFFFAPLDTSYLLPECN